MITHETRRESYEQLDRTTIHKHIINILANREMTAREIAVEMYEKKFIPYPVRQAVAPRLTELVAEEKVKVIGKVFDDETQRKVAVYKAVR